MLWGRDGKGTQRMATYGICIDGNTEPYVLSQTRDWLEPLVEANETRGHTVVVVTRDTECVICTDPIDAWQHPDDDPVHDGACRSEFEEWRHADIGAD